MAYFPGEAIRRATAPRFHAPAASLAQGANNQRDVTTGQGNGGYGSYVLPPDPAALARIVNSQPGVMNAQLARHNEGAQSQADFRTFLQNLLIQRGDTDLARQLGIAVDPATAKLVQENTDPAGGGVGNSAFAQFRFAGQQSRDNLLAHLAATGQENSGQLGFALKNFDIGQSQGWYNQSLPFLNQLSTANQQNLATQNKLATGVQQAIINSTGYVNQHPTQFQLPTPQGVRVGAAPNPQYYAPPEGLPKLPAAPTLKQQHQTLGMH